MDGRNNFFLLSLSRYIPGRFVDTKGDDGDELFAQFTHSDALERAVLIDPRGVNEEEGEEGQISLPQTLFFSRKMHRLLFLSAARRNKISPR